MEILNSASKLVLLLIALSVVATFCAVVFYNLEVEAVITPVLAIASGAVSSVFTYYFTKASIEQSK